MDTQERAQAWLAFASAATCGLSTGDEDIRDICADAETIADNMLEAYEERFGGKKPKKRGGRKAEDEEG